VDVVLLKKRLLKKLNNFIHNKCKTPRFIGAFFYVTNVAVQVSFDD
jgi:hypothetical protein